MLGVGFLLFKYRLFGGGDAKLMAAASLWLGSGAVLPFLAYTAVSGGVLGVAILAFRLLFRHSRGHESISRREVPYGIALAVGAITALAKSQWAIGS